MKETYNGCTIIAEPSTPIANVARAFDEAGHLICEVFTLNSEYDAIKGAKLRIDRMGFTDNSIIGKVILKISSIRKMLKRRAKNKLAKKSRRNNW